MQLLYPTVISNEQIGNDFLRLRFTWVGEAPLPGQFLTVRSSEGTAPLLRRPFAFSNFTDNTAEILYQKRGQATGLLTRLRAGDTFDALGPLGNTFPLDSKNALVTAGGIGLGPVLFYLEYLLGKGAACTGAAGFRSASLVPDFLKDDSRELHICTDDGTLGFKGNPVQFIEQNVADFSLYDAISTCGPEPLLKATTRLGESRGLPVFVSMEQVMACGVGACMGCTVRVKGPQKYARVCKEGPVFEGSSIAWT